METVGAGWRQLETVGAGWRQLEPVGDSRSRLDTVRADWRQLEPVVDSWSHYIIGWLMPPTVFLHLLPLLVCKHKKSVGDSCRLHLINHWEVRWMPCEVGTPRKNISSIQFIKVAAPRWETVGTSPPNDL